MSESPNVDYNKIYNNIFNDMKKHTPEENTLNKLLPGNSLFETPSKLNFKFNIYYLSIIISFILTILICIKPPSFIRNDKKDEKNVIVKKLSIFKVFLLFIFLLCISSLFVWIRSKNYFRT
jgi:hypothetical protein